MQGVEYTNLAVFLAWLAGPAGVVAWAVIVSDFVRNHPEYLAKMGAGARQAVTLAGMVVPPALAYVVLQVVPGDVIAALQPHYAFVASVAVALLGSRVLFELSKHAPAG